MDKFLNYDNRLEIEKVIIKVEIWLQILRSLSKCGTR